VKDIDYRVVKVGDEEVLAKGALNKVYDVFNKNMFKDNIVLIHGTRGINKTGHAVCYYLCKRLELKPSEAIKRFEEARRYPIDKKAVIEDLLDKFD